MSDAKERIKDNASRLDPVRLQFDSQPTEWLFRADHAARIRLQSRVALLVGAGLYVLLGMQDPWFFGASYALPWFVRSVVATGLIAAFAATFRRDFRQRNQPLLLISFLVCGAGVLVMISIAPPAAANSYYVGLLLCIVWAYSLSGLRFYAALVGNAVLIVAYGLLEAFWIDGPVRWLFTNVSNLLAASAIVAFSGYLIEWQRRMMFRQALLIDLERKSHVQLALYDQLTGLPNRVLLEQRMDRALVRAERQNTRVAVLFVDMDDFKPVNDTYGHRVGDEVLKEIGERLKASVRHMDTVARIGGDEFIVIIEDVHIPDDVEIVASKIQNCLDEPFTIRNHTQPLGTARISASIGAAVFPDDGTFAKTLIQHADTAMYQAKQSGGKGFQFYRRAAVVADGETRAIS